MDTSFELPHELSPLLNDSARTFLKDIHSSEFAPMFNHIAGDRIFHDDLGALADFREALTEGVPLRFPGNAMKAWVENKLETVPEFRRSRHAYALKNHGRDLDVNRWDRIPTMSRETLALRPESLIADDADLSRLIVYRTAGTTGHPLLVPHHPVAAASYQVMIQVALSKCGIVPRFERGRIACYLIGAQKSTVTYPTVLSAWNHAGFAKLNLYETNWRSPDHRRKFLEQFPAEILTGDPTAFATLMELDANVWPQALITTSVAMTPGLKERLESRFKAPVIDWYSLTETGPIGFIKPGEDAYTILPHDLFVEVVDEEGRAVPEGDMGEIAVTGGRNPFVPLLRYRTGDFGRRIGDKLHDLEGRKPVRFQSATGRSINTVDIARTLREYPIVQHHFLQKNDGSCEVTIRPFMTGGDFPSAKLAAELGALFGGFSISVLVDRELGDRTPGGKVLPYVTEVKFED